MHSQTIWSVKYSMLLEEHVLISSFFKCLDSLRLREFLTIFAQSSIPDLALLVEVNTWKLIPGWSKILSEFYLAEWCVSKLRNLSVLRSSLDFLDFEFAARIGGRAVSKNWENWNNNSQQPHFGICNVLWEGKWRKDQWKSRADEKVDIFLRK